MSVGQEEAVLTQQAAGDYKLIEFFEDNRLELYNLNDDIGEKKDLIGFAGKNSGAAHDAEKVADGNRS